MQTIETLREPFCGVAAHHTRRLAWRHHNHNPMEAAPVSTKAHEAAASHAASSVPLRLVSQEVWASIIKEAGAHAESAHEWIGCLI